ncbi:MAG: hypothetical protein GY821_05040 [Gammaproteobacteria bacterium]|nr:hypothetical protein [Gammaproteobacteria bacterium]
MLWRLRAIHKIIQCMSKNASQCENNLSELALTKQELNALAQPETKQVLSESLQVVGMNVNVNAFISRVEQSASANRSRNYGAHDKGYWCQSSQWGHKPQNSAMHNHVIIDDYYTPAFTPS